MSDSALEIVRDHHRLFDQLQHDAMDPAIGLQILTACAVPQMIFLSRCIPPSVIREALDLFDEFTMTTLEALLTRDNSRPTIRREASLQSQLAQSDGGYGLTPSVVISPFAYQGGLAQAAQTVRGNRQRVHVNGAQISPRYSPMVSEGIIANDAIMRSSLDFDGRAEDSKEVADAAIAKLIPPAEVYATGNPKAVMAWYSSNHVVAYKLQKEFSVLGKLAFWSVFYLLSMALMLLVFMPARHLRQVSGCFIRNCSQVKSMSLLP